MDWSPVECNAIERFIYRLPGSQHAICSCAIELISSVSIDSDSLLPRIESSAFSYSFLASIVIPGTTETLAPFCFDGCEFLASVLIEFDSLLWRIESDAFLVLLSYPSSFQGRLRFSVLSVSVVANPFHLF
jgi:hypothetical protein